MGKLKEILQKKGQKMDGEAKIKTHKETRKLLMNAKDTGQRRL